MGMAVRRIEVAWGAFDVLITGFQTLSATEHHKSGEGFEYTRLGAWHKVYGVGWMRAMR